MMDSTDDVTNNDEIEKRVRTLWVGNLHPKVSNRDVAELFYQVGPVEYVEFAYDENDICENFALVVFKYPSSVEDSIKFFKGTKLYGLPIITKNYSKHFEDPVFNDQLNYFKQLIKVEQNCQPNNSSAESQWIDQSLNEKNIPESLPKPPMHEERGFNKNQDNYDRRCSSKVNSSKFRHNARHSKNHNSVNSGEHYPIDRSHRSQKHYKNSEHNSSSSSMEVSNYERDSYYHNSNNDHKHHDNTSFNRKESAYRYQEPRSMHDKDSSNDMIVRDLRDTMFRKRSRLDSNFHIDMNTNAGCTSLLDLRDTMYHRKNNRYEDQGQQHHESDSNNRWSERNQDMHGNGNFSNKEPRKNNYNSERYSESNTKHQNHYADRGYNRGKSHNGFQDCGNESTSNYNDGYRRDKNRPTNNKYNNPQNMESSSRQHNSYHPYQRNNEHSGQSRGRSYNKGGSDRSRHNYYS